jgi:hypothetical protein
MAQLYLLSVLTNMIAGLTLAGDFIGEEVPFLSSFKNLRGSRGAQIAVAITVAIVGVLTFFVRAPGDTVPVAGDLLPSLTGVVQGIILLVESFRARIELAAPRSGKLSSALITYRVPVGIAGAAIGIAHFLFPAAVIL